MSMIDKILDSYKPLIIIPVIITLLALGIILSGGLKEGIDLKGGSIAVLQITEPVSNNQLISMVSNSTGVPADLITATTTGNNQSTVQITGSAADVVKVASAINGVATIQSYNSVGPLLSTQSLTQVYYALAFAFLFMSITVFIIF